ncbi:MAG: hypothetical protein AB1758_26705 [Candidatus Eremiobacterota bacterium]
MYDKKAVRILFHTYWCSDGWVSDPTVDEDDAAYAISKGVMFPPVKLTHDEVVERARQAADAVKPRQVGAAFLASLSTRDLALRSALGSYAAARHLTAHKARKNPCQVCNELNKREEFDLSVLNFERLKWGGVRHLRPSYAWFDLTEFRKLPPAKPTEKDAQILKHILSIATSQPDTARPGQLEKLLRPIVPGNTWERRIVLDILGIAGVLQPSDHPGFLHAYVDLDRRAEPPEYKNDWNYPFCWWRGSDGVNSEAVKLYFPGV